LFLHDLEVVTKARSFL